MFFGIDVGNTNIVFGVFAEDGGLQDSWRVNSGTFRTADEYAALVNNMIEFAGISFKDISIFAVSSVVPHITPQLIRMNEKYIGADLFEVDYKQLTGFGWKIDDPREVGADRLCNIAGGYYLYGGPLIIIDFGTAMTFDVIDADRNYLGGAIAPGLETTMSILHDKASKLPKVQLSFPPSATGKNTIEHIQSGIMFGTAAMVDGMVRRFWSELGTEAKVIATGGLAGVISQATETITATEPDLILLGLKYIYDLQRDTDAS